MVPSDTHDGSPALQPVTGLDACTGRGTLYAAAVASGGRRVQAATARIAYEPGDVAHQSLGQSIRIAQRNQMTAGDLIRVEAKSFCGDAPLDVGR